MAQHRGHTVQCKHAAQDRQHDPLPMSFGSSLMVSVASLALAHDTLVCEQCVAAILV